jgi:hypothetical protein
MLCRVVGNYDVVKSLGSRALASLYCVENILEMVYSMCFNFGLFC